MSDSPLNLHRDVRDSEIRQARERRATAETRIAQQVMAVNREAFRARFPGQLEHHMRLVAERLTWCLTKPPGCELDQPQTWPASPDEIFALTHSLRNLDEIRCRWPQVPDASSD